MTKTSIPPATDRDRGSAPDSLVRELIGRITRLEIIVGALVAAVLLLLVLIEPNILEAPFENERTLLFTFGGTVLAAVALVAMLWFRVPAVVRVVVLVVPFAIVNWWLVSPYFVDDTVDEGFSTSISQQAATAGETPATPATPEDGGESVSGSVPPATETPPPADPESTGEEPSSTEDELATPPPANGPALLGAGQFVGLAGHSGTGDAGIFENPDGSLVLRFENFDIQNGPDLEVYLVPGPDQTSPPEGSIHLGALKGNIGDQNYELPPGTELAPGAYTALVWCEAFSVEFVGATIVVG
ncbi:MAG: DM13 domain-containing protein [Acidimicrobiia bacterium]|nr:DM13 domain-containing protein [Acidimicrobiia bacterium]